MSKIFKKYFFHTHILGLAILLSTVNVINANASPLSLKSYLGEDVLKVRDTEYYIEKSKEVPKENNFCRMIEHADKRHFSEGLRWQKYVGVQGYYDCKVHRNIDCKNPAFVNCWECREYYVGKDGKVRKINNYTVTRNGDIIIWED